MDELCPVCLKMGLNRRIKAVQINTEEAIWMCENEECPWPLLHEAPNFLPRKVGEKWAYEWEIYKKVQKRLGPIPVSTELSLYTPPVTPSNDTASKEIVKSEFPGETSISDVGNANNEYTINSTPNDSYAPESILHNDDANLASNAVAKVCIESDRTKISQEPKETSPKHRKTSLVPSIFDIDGDELLSNKISFKDNSGETKIPNLSKVQSDVLDVRNSEIDKSSDAVLKTPPKRKFPPIKIVKNRKESIISGAEDETSRKPKIRSISRANVDLKRIESEKFASTQKVETAPMTVETAPMTVETAPMTVETAPMTVEAAPMTVKTAPMTVETAPMTVETAPMTVETAPMTVETTLNNGSTPSTPEKSSVDDNDRCNASRQRTTTITVAGNLPITLSYDISDLGDESIDAKPVVLSPVRVESTADISENSTQSPIKVDNTTTDLSIKEPKKDLRLGTKRRAASLVGKQYEKFNFNALKKFVPETKSSNDDLKVIYDLSRHNVINERVKFQQNANLKSERDIRYTMNSFAPLPVVTDRHLSKQESEPLTSMNIDSNTVTISEEASAETLNLSGVLDDILIEGFQNANENLNDDWLESFFT